MIFHRFRGRRSRRWNGSAAVRPAEQSPASPSPAAGGLGRSDLAEETEAFLHGSLAELRSSNGEAIAAWMILNRIGHGDMAELYEVAGGDLDRASLRRASPAYRRMWNRTQRNLAMRLLTTSRDEAGIRQVQDDVLVPLELSLVARSYDELLTFWQVVDAACEALDHHELNR